MIPPPTVRTLVKQSPPCKCSDPFDRHELPRDLPPDGRGPNTSRCRNPSCGCMRYRPDPTKGA